MNQSFTSEEYLLTKDINNRNNRNLIPEENSLKFKKLSLKLLQSDGKDFRDYFKMEL